MYTIISVANSVFKLPAQHVDSPASQKPAPPLLSLHSCTCQEKIFWEIT